MKVQRSFTVPASQAAVLAGLTDVAKIAECLPGGLVEGRERGGRFGGSFALQLGTATAPYTAIIAIAERDDEAGRAVVTVSGHDDQGDGTAEVTAAFAVRGQGDVTAVDETHPALAQGDRQPARFPLCRAEPLHRIRRKY